MSFAAAHESKRTRHTCQSCLDRKARFSFRGSVRADRDHTLCFECYRRRAGATAGDASVRGAGSAAAQGRTFHSRPSAVPSAIERWRIDGPCWRRWNGTQWRKPSGASRVRVMRLSKSRFMSGLQCHKQLWWRVHEPDAPELVSDPAQQALFDQGHLVGAKAREHFPGGVFVDAHYSDFAGRVAQTQAALAARAPAIFEAAFVADDIFVAVDVLERGERGWTLVEVKSSTGVKQPYLSDAAIQTHVLRRSGVHVERVEIMHLNRECRFPDLQNLFVRADVTDEVAAILPEIIPEAGAQLHMLEGPLPDVVTGDHCETPYACPFQARCWPRGARASCAHAVPYREQSPGVGRAGRRDHSRCARRGRVLDRHGAAAEVGAGEPAHRRVVVAGLHWTPSRTPAPSWTSKRSSWRFQSGTGADLMSRCRFSSAVTP